MSKTEIKKREKLEEKKKKDDEKKRAKAEKDAQEEEKNPKKNHEQEEELDPTKYTENRKNMLQAMREKGENPYPHKFHRTMRVDEYVAHYTESLQENGVFNQDKQESLTGRIKSIRSSGDKLIFIDLVGDEGKVQVMLSAEHYRGDFENLHHVLRRGDIIGLHGHPGRTKKGELSIRPFEVVPLSYCLHQLPVQKQNGEHVLNKDTRYRYRYQDLILHPDVRQKFKVRS